MSTIHSHLCFPSLQRLSSVRSSTVLKSLFLRRQFLGFTLRSKADLRLSDLTPQTSKVAFRNKYQGAPQKPSNILYGSDLKPNQLIPLLRPKQNPGLQVDVGCSEGQPQLWHNFARCHLCSEYEANSLFRI